MLAQVCDAFVSNRSAPGERDRSEPGHRFQKREVMVDQIAAAGQIDATECWQISKMSEEIGRDGCVDLHSTDTLFRKALNRIACERVAQQDVSGSASL